MDADQPASRPLDFDPNIPEPDSPSIVETLNYINQRVASGFGQTADFAPGWLTIDPQQTKLFWSRWHTGEMSRVGEFLGVSTALGDCFRGIAMYSVAAVNDLDPKAIDFNPKTSEVDIGCKRAGCWQRWAQCTSRKDGDNPRGYLLQTAGIADGSKAIDTYQIQSIATNGDPEAAANFSRAIRHLVRLMQALPQNRNQVDPFAK